MSFGKKKSSPPPQDPKALPGGTWTGDPATSTTGPTPVQKAEAMETARTPSLLTADEDEQRRRQQSLMG